LKLKGRVPGALYTESVIGWCRVVSGLAVLLAMLGLPVASVLCELACPQASAEVSRGATRTPARIAAVGSGVPCHEVADAAASGAEDARLPVVAIHSTPAHGCDHPAVVSLRRSAEGVRVPAPPVIAVPAILQRDWSHHVPPGVTARWMPEHRAAVGTVGAFSPVLRI
jgi:hypothetical protein